MIGGALWVNLSYHVVEPISIQRDLKNCLILFPPIECDGDIVFGAELAFVR